MKKISIYGLFGHLNHQIPIHPGGITFIHGPNGCGKTTVLRLISAIFSWDTSTLFETNFSKIEILEENETKFVVEKEFKSPEDSKRPIPVLTFSLQKTEGELFTKTESFVLSLDSSGVTGGSTRTPTRPMASPFLWALFVPYALRAPAPVNLGVRPLPLRRLKASNLLGLHMRAVVSINAPRV